MPKMSYFALLFLSFLLTFHATTALNLVTETCKKCAANDPNIDYNFCVSSLQSDNRAQSANLQELGMISMQLTSDKVTSTNNGIEQLLKNKKLDSFVRACLNDCHGLYSDGIDTLKEAIGDYKAKHYDDANIKVSSIIDATTTCEDGFNEKEGVVSPLTKRNNDTSQLSAIALTIMKMLAP